MKKYIYLLVLLFVFGCTSTSPQPWTTQTNLYGLDFREYTSNGFMFTPNEYNGEYESLGLITVQIIPEVRKKPTPTGKWKRAYSISSGTWWIEELDSSRLLSDAYTYSVELGADALAQIAIDEIELVNGDIFVSGLELSGFAIKRK